VKKIVGIILGLCVILMLTACGQERQESYEASGVTSEASDREQLNEDEEAADGDQADTGENEVHTEPATLQIDFATEELLGRYENFREFIYVDEAVYMIIWTDIQITNFEFVRVGNSFDLADWDVDEDTALFFFVDEVIYSVGDLTPEVPFKLKSWSDWGPVPRIGVSFTDTDGTVRYFHIQESMMDGVLRIIEFENMGDMAMQDASPAQAGVGDNVTNTYATASRYVQGSSTNPTDPPQSAETPATPITTPQTPSEQEPSNNEQPISRRFTIEEYYGPAPAALELIFEDGQSRYYLSSYRSRAIMLTFTDGERMSLRQAIEREKVIIGELIANGLTLIYVPAELVPVPPSQPATTSVRMVVQNVSATGISFVLENPSDREYIFGSGYALMVRPNGLWGLVEPIIDWDWIFTDEGFSLLPNSTTDTITIDWQWNLGELQSGNYRFQKDVIFSHSPGNFDRFTLVHEFVV